MSDWIDGIPSEEGDYWLRLSPTDKICERLQKYNMTCYAGMCGCHKSLINLDERNQSRIDLGFYVVTGYVKLPNGN